jgi:hypothetical protein
MKPFVGLQPKTNVLVAVTQWFQALTAISGSAERVSPKTCIPCFTSLKLLEYRRILLEVLYIATMNATDMKGIGWTISGALLLQE